MIYETEVFVHFPCFMCALVVISFCTFKLMKRARVYWIEHKAVWTGPLTCPCACQQAVKRMWCYNLYKLWIYADISKAFGSYGSCLRSVGFGTSTQPAVESEGITLHPVKCSGGLKSSLRLWSEFGKANLLACAFYLLFVIYSMYNAHSYNFAWSMYFLISSLPLYGGRVVVSARYFCIFLLSHFTWLYMIFISE